MSDTTPDGTPAAAPTEVIRARLRQLAAQMDRCRDMPSLFREDYPALAHAGQYLTGEVSSPPPGLPAIPDLHMQTSTVSPVRPPPCGPACGGKRKCAQCGRRG